MSLTAEQIGLIQDSRLRRLAEYWDSKRGAALVPDKRDIDAADFWWILPFAWLAERLPGTARMRFRLAGEEINALYHRRIHGAWFDEVFDPARAEGAARRVNQALDTPAVAHSFG